MREQEESTVSCGVTLGEGARLVEAWGLERVGGENLKGVLVFWIGERLQPPQERLDS